MLMGELLSDPAAPRDADDVDLPKLRDEAGRKPRQRRRPIGDARKRRAADDAATKGSRSAGDALLRNPTTGSAGCCPRAASGNATAAPPSSVMNSRRLNSSNCIRSPPARATLQDIEWAGISQRVFGRSQLQLG
jgi:hypothetical protein